MSNMELWDAVQRTDPAHTKKVNQRGGFTAIDAHYQVQQATKAFGPVGKGWGYEVTNREVHLTNGVSLSIAEVILWHGNREQAYGPVTGCAELLNTKGRIDTDAPKKAATDALTKALSHLGFSADVFLGKFDDNKYVQQVAKEIKAETTPPRVKEILAAIKDIETSEQLENAKGAWGKEVQAMQKEDPASFQLINAAIRTQVKTIGDN